MRTFDDLDEFVAATGHVLDSSDWLQITQDRVDTFASATGDFQWIHVDPGRAEHGPFGSTIAHGYLTLCLVPALNAGIFSIRGIGIVDLGLRKVRFPHPVPVGAAVRASTELTAVEQRPGGLEALLTSTVVIRDVAKPACVVQTISRLSPER